MYRDRMTPRERWLAVLRRERPDRVPMDIWSTSEAFEKLMRHLGVSSVDETLAALHIDAPYTLNARYVGPELPAGENEFGCRFTQVDYGTGTYSEITHYPLAHVRSVAEIQAEYRWPEPDWWVYDHIPEEVERAGDRPIRGGGSEIFLAYCTLRGQEQAFMDLVEDPDLVHYCLDKLLHLAYENTRRILEAAGGAVMICYVAEDLGSQESLMFSPQQIRTFLLPRMRLMADLVHRHGGWVFTHSDGAVRAIIPDLLDMGMDVLNPVQWRCRGMEREGLKADFGDRLIFHGAVDNQQTLAFGSVDDVRREVADNLRILGAGGGYILAPCHNIQPVSPPENIVAMYEEGYLLGRT